MNLQGDFEGLTLASVLQLLCNEQKTGVLTVTCENEKSRVFFEHGTIVYASSSLKETRLGFLLRNDNVTSARQLKESIATGKETRVHLGKILVDKGYISIDTLKKYSTKQAETILYNIFFWKKGKFKYQDAQLNLKGMIIIQLNPMKLILEASRRIDELSVLRELIPSDELVFKISGKVQSNEEIKLNANEWRVLSLIDGIRTVGQITTESGYDEFAVYKILFSVISSGLIEQKEETTTASHGETSENYSEAIIIFNDIFQAIKKNIVEEIGANRSESLFKESKQKLVMELKTVFKNYHPDNDENTNLQAIESALEAMPHIEKTNNFLISGFSEYCGLVLQATGDLLGTQPLNNSLKDIEKILDYVATYQTDSKGKEKIVNDMTRIIELLRSHFNIDKKSKKNKKGWFSFF
ncbi:protein of unknown function [Desulfocicer vacuolatum DSM 3385]|uniref:PatA-like N-terminal domain-containing protein n=1 Tax=Desulfocicer vacuolatum DSM 3385 TaxID=1121400 RepID=A0A1W2B866_9BACT|nr:DUF4388 domain-containing protein [Desulfocicer vacuolatum]SMC69116.1 protein of unknown function [Desulfocicer vacuolatum DSM 3385]